MTRSPFESCVGEGKRHPRAPQLTRVPASVNQSSLAWPRMALAFCCLPIPAPRSPPYFPNPVLAVMQGQRRVLLPSKQAVVSARHLREHVEHSTADPGGEPRGASLTPAWPHCATQNPTPQGARPMA